MKSTTTRRSFLKAAGAVSAYGLASRLNVLSAIADAHAQAAADYKALVCVFLYGGNDGNNTVIPIDTAGYAQYAAVRTTASGINLARDALLPITPVNVGTPFGLHPSLGALQTLFNSGQLAILANVGTLLQPTTKTDYNAGVRPESLYSHSDQQTQWQSAVSNTVSGTGWGGRIADTLTGYNAGTSFPVVTSLSGTVLYTTGSSAVPLAVPVSGSFALSGFANNAAGNARLAAVNALLGQSSSNVFVNGAESIGRQALSLSSLVNPILTNANSTIAPLFSSLTSTISKQFFQVAKLIEARAATGARRQIFFVQLGSFDTHTDQLARQQTLFNDLSAAMKAFYDATASLGVASQVTTFTLSDFGRTFQPASGAGSDHAWGSHHFVMGGAVKGGAMYGQYPQLVLNGPSDAESEGRWIPSSSVDQYGATLARWMGVPPSALGTVFPNLYRFASSDLGFLS